MLLKKKLNRNVIKAAIISATLITLSPAVLASNFGAAAKVGTLGGGVEVDYALSNMFSIRGQVNSFAYDSDFEESGIDYTGELDLSTGGLLLDWRPFSGSFRVTAGGYSNNNKLTGFSSGEGSYEIGDRTYTVSAVNGSAGVNAEIELGDGFTPYFGFGFGNKPSNKGGFMFSFDAGVLFQGEPNVNLTASGTATDQQTGLSVDLASDPTVQNELRNEELNLQNELGDFDMYPVVSFSVGYRF